MCHRKCPSLDSSGHARGKNSRPGGQLQVAGSAYLCTRTALVLMYEDGMEELLQKWDGGGDRGMDRESGL